MLLHSYPQLLILVSSLLLLDTRVHNRILLFLVFSLEIDFSLHRVVCKFTHTGRLRDEPREAVAILLKAAKRVFMCWLSTVSCRSHKLYKTQSTTIANLLI